MRGSETEKKLLIEHIKINNAASTKEKVFNVCINEYTLYIIYYIVICYELVQPILYLYK